MEFRRSESVTFEVIDQRAVLLDPDGVELITLNPVGTLVWELLEPPCAPEAIVAGLVDRFPDVPVDALRADVDHFLSDLSARGLVSGNDAGG